MSSCGEKQQVSHLHIVEGALPLTEIALQCSYPCSDFYFVCVVILMVYFFRIDTLEFIDIGEGWLHPPQTPLQAGEPPAHR